MIHCPALPTNSTGFTGATQFLDLDHPAVQAFAHDAIGNSTNERDQAVKLFYAVRDKIRYDPYQITFQAPGYKASAVASAGYGWCVPKAGLLAACARVVGIPSALGLADVVNHMTSEKLQRKMGGVNVFYDHGYAALMVDGRWLKAVPAFNIELCQRFGVVPTEFDGCGDALYQEYDAHGRLHMQYLTDHGTFSDMPLARIIEDFKRYYPPSLMVEDASDSGGPRFEDEARRA